MRTKVEIKKLNENATVPTYGTEFSAGADIYALIEDGSVTIEAGETKMIGTGLAFAIPEGLVGLIFARSSLGTKRGLAPANKVGVIWRSTDAEKRKRSEKGRRPGRLLSETRLWSGADFRLGNPRVLRRELSAKGHQNKPAPRAARSSSL